MYNGKKNVRNNELFILMEIIINKYSLSSNTLILSPFEMEQVNGKFHSRQVKGELKQNNHPSTNLFYSLQHLPFRKPDSNKGLH